MGEIKLAIEAMIVMRYFDIDVKHEKGVVPCWDSAVSSSWYSFAVTAEHVLVLALMVGLYLA